MNTSNDTSTSARIGSLSDGADQLSGKIERTLQDAQVIAGDAMRTLKRDATDIRAGTSDAVTHAALHAEEVAHRALDRAREAVRHARERATGLRDSTADHVRADPMKALVVAAAAGAATALLVRWLSRSRQQG